MTPEEIAADIVRRIDAGAFRRGDPLPTIGELQADYGATRYRIEQARAVLVDQRAIELRPGLGAVVSRRAATRSPDTASQVYELRDRLADEISSLQRTIDSRDREGRIAEAEQPPS